MPTEKWEEVRAREIARARSQGVSEAGEPLDVAELLRATHRQLRTRGADDKLPAPERRRLEHARAMEAASFLEAEANRFQAESDELRDREPILAARLAATADVLRSRSMQLRFEDPDEAERLLRADADEGSGMPMSMSADEVPPYGEIAHEDYRLRPYWGWAIMTLGVAIGAMLIFSYLPAELYRWSDAAPHSLVWIVAALAAWVLGPIAAALVQPRSYTKPWWPGLFGATVGLLVACLIVALSFLTGIGMVPLR